MITLVTPKELVGYFALARHLGVTLSDLIRSLLARERTRLERGGVKVPKK